MRKIINYYSTFKTLKPRQLLSILLIMFVTSGCSDIIEGGAHIGYGITTFLIGLLKIGGIILLIVVVFAIIASFFD
jgi:hypothetical protein